jgi:multiple sugar transport system substrate-binding protein
MEEGEIMNEKKFSRRNFLKAAAVTAAGAALVACQPAATQESGKEPATGQQPPAKEKQKVTFSMYGHPGLVELMVPKFNDSHDDVELVFERSEGQGYWEKLTAAVAAGTAWDCFRGDATRMHLWGPKGVIMDVTKYVESDTEYPKEDYLPGVLDTYTIGGKIYGVPTWALTMWMFYNKKMFDEAGIPYPTPAMTWTEYLDVAKKMTKTDGDRVTQFGGNGWNGWTFPLMQLIFSNGGHFYFNDDKTKVAVDDPKTVEVLQSVADMYLIDKSVPNPSAPASSPIGILSDNVATEGNGDYIPADNNDVFMEKYEYIDACLCPSFDGQRKNVYWPDGFFINSKTSVADGAYKWMAWFSRDPEATAIQCKVVTPVYGKAFTDDSIASRWLVAPRPKGMIAQAKEHAQNPQLVRFEAHSSEIDTIYYNEIGKLWSGEATAEDVAKRITELGNEAMAKSVG